MYTHHERIIFLFHLQRLQKFPFADLYINFFYNMNYKKKVFLCAPHGFKEWDVSMIIE